MMGKADANAYRRPVAISNAEANATYFLSSFCTSHPPKPGRQAFGESVFPVLALTPLEIARGSGWPEVDR